MVGKPTTLKCTNNRPPALPTGTQNLSPLHSSPRGAGTQPVGSSAEAAHLDLAIWRVMFRPENPFVKAMSQTLCEKSLQLKGLWIDRTAAVLQLLFCRSNSADPI